MGISHISSLQIELYPTVYISYRMVALDLWYVNKISSRYCLKHLEWEGGWMYDKIDIPFFYWSMIFILEYGYLQCTFNYNLYWKYILLLLLLLLLLGYCFRKLCLLLLLLLLLLDETQEYVLFRLFFSLSCFILGTVSKLSLILKRLNF